MAKWLTAGISMDDDDGKSIEYSVYPSDVHWCLRITIESQWTVCFWPISWNPLTFFAFHLVCYDFPLSFPSAPSLSFTFSSLFISTLCCWFAPQVRRLFCINRIEINDNKCPVISHNRKIMAPLNRNQCINVNVNANVCVCAQALGIYTKINKMLGIEDINDGIATMDVRWTKPFWQRTNEWAIKRTNERASWMCEKVREREKELALASTRPTRCHIIEFHFNLKRKHDFSMAFFSFFWWMNPRHIIGKLKPTPGWNTS